MGVAGSFSSITIPHVCSTRVYAADLESALHYMLRVELATRDHLEGEELRIVKDFVSVVAKVTGSHVWKFRRAVLHPQN